MATRIRPQFRPALLLVLAVVTLLNSAIFFGVSSSPAIAQATPVAASYHYFSFDITLKSSVSLAKEQEQALATAASKWRLEFRGDNRTFVSRLLPVSSSGNSNTSPTLAVYRLLSRLDLAQKSGQLVLVDTSGTIVGSQQLDWNSPGDYNLTGSFALKVVEDSANAAGSSTAEFDKTSYQLKGGLHSWASGLVTQLSNQTATNSPPVPVSVSAPVAGATPVSTTPNSAKNSSSTGSSSPVANEAGQATASTITTRTVRRGGNPVLLIILTLLFWGLGVVLLVHAFQVGLFRFSFGAAGTSASLAMPKEQELRKGKRQSKGKETSPLDLLPKQKQKDKEKQKAGQAVASLPGENNEATSQPIRGTNQAISNSEPNLKLVVTPPVGAATSLLGELDEVQMPPNQNQISFAVPVSSGRPQQRDEIDGPTITSKQNQVAKINPAGARSEEAALNQSEIELGQEREGGQVGYTSSSSISANSVLTAPTQAHAQAQQVEPVFELEQKTVLFTGNLKKLDSQFERDALDTLLQDNAVGYWLSADKVEIKNQVYLKDLAKNLWSTTGSTGFGSAESAFMGNDSRLDFLLRVERVGYPTRLVAVETDGPQHFSDEAQRKRDVKKNRILEKLSIPLIRVSHVGQLQVRLEALPAVLWEGATAPVHPTIFIKLDPATKSKFPFNFSFKSAKAKARATQARSKTGAGKKSKTSG